MLLVIGMQIYQPGKSLLTWSIQSRILEVLSMYFHPCMSLENVSFITFLFLWSVGLFILESNELKPVNNGKEDTSIRMVKPKISISFLPPTFRWGCCYVKVNETSI